MKKIILAAAVVMSLGLASCSSVKHTATTVPVDATVAAPATADLKVSQQKITFTYKPSKAVRRSGNNGVLAAAVAEALRANGNADVLVSPQYVITKKRRSIRQVIVTGYPATYTNIVPVK